MTIGSEILSGWVGTPTKSEGRTQLSSAFKETMREALAEATGEDKAAFDFRSLSSSAQTTRASSESMGTRSTMGREKKTWVFLGRVSQQEAEIAETLRARLGKVCSVAVLFSKNSDWNAYAIQYHPNYKALCEKLCIAFGFDQDEAKVFENIAPDDKDEVGHESNGSTPLLGSEDIFLDDSELENIRRNLVRKKNVILTGPPGTGKTFVAEKLAAQIMGDSGKASLTKIQFHPSYSYEDFVRGWRPAENGFVVVDGVLVNIASAAADDPEGQHVLLIDEINRAHVTKVFGELLSLVEATKRGPRHELRLPYGPSATDEDADASFYMPENVYIIGTMNTADRSIAMVDYALRRRFSFFYIGPAFHSDKFHRLLRSSGIPQAFINALSDVMSELNEEIISSNDLGKGYEIGHSYFVPRGVLGDSAQWYRDIVETELAPLLYEYWFEDEETAKTWVERLRSIEPLLHEEDEGVQGVQDGQSEWAVKAAVDANTNP